jgi:hypothetical protein
MHADWGADQPYLKDSWPSEPLPPERLPVVVAARSHGWHLAPDAPVWSFLPAVWPAHARAWVPDRAVRVVRLQCDDDRVDAVIPWSAWDHAEVEGDTNTLLSEAGLPPRPFGRLWLLRPPPGFDELDDAVDAVISGAAAAGVPLRLCAELVAWTTAAVTGWFATTG